MKALVLWGESPDYQYEQYFNTIAEAKNWISNAFGGQVVWNTDKESHWCELYTQIELE